MTQKLLFFSAALTASTLLLGSDISHAGGWRCVDVPDLPECQDALINDIESIVVEDWSSLTLTMPALRYSCTRTGGGNPFAPDPDAALTVSAASQIDWSIELSTDLRSFLLGQDTAAADLFGSVTLSGDRVTRQTWTGTAMNFVFGESNTEVTAPGGSTGVIDLGEIRSSITAGAFWSGNLRFEIQPIREGTYSCVVGPVNAQVHKTGRDRVIVDYPISWTPIQAVIAEGIREQFRRAVRIAVTGMP